MKEKYIPQDAPYAQDAICDLVIQRKFDHIDLQIIAERESKPMPSMRDIALRIGVSVGTVHNRVERMKRLIAPYIPA